MSDGYTLTPAECTALQRKAFDEGQRDMLAKALAAVEALDVCWYADNACQSPNHGILNDVYLALRALLEGEK